MSSVWGPLVFIRPGRPVENPFIESFNRWLQDECLNVDLFFSLNMGGANSIAAARTITISVRADQGLNLGHPKWHRHSLR